LEHFVRLVLVIASIFVWLSYVCVQPAAGHETLTGAEGAKDEMHRWRLNAGARPHPGSVGLLQNLLLSPRCGGSMRTITPLYGAETPQVRLNKVSELDTRLIHESVREGSTVAEHSETYKGRRIMVRPRTAEATTERAAAEGAEPELYIDDEPVFTVRDGSGAYIAAGFAYAPETSLVNLAKRIIDYRDAIQ
jgi:hypothetical protein